MSQHGSSSGGRWESYGRFATQEEEELENDRLNLERFREVAFIASRLPRSAAHARNLREHATQEPGWNGTPGHSNFEAPPNQSQGPQASTRFGSQSTPPMQALPEPPPRLHSADEAFPAMPSIPFEMTRPRSQPNVGHSPLVVDAMQASTPRQSIFYGDIIDREGKLHEVQISDDTLTPVNWIHPHILEQCNLPWERFSTSPVFEDANGKHIKSTRYVFLTWVGTNNVNYQMTFHVGSGKVTIPRLILGNDFISEHGRAMALCRLERRIQDAKVLVQLPPTVSDSISKQSYHVV